MIGLIEHVSHMLSGVVVSNNPLLAYKQMNEQQRAAVAMALFFLIKEVVRINPSAELTAREHLDAILEAFEEEPLKQNDNENTTTQKAN